MLKKDLMKQFGKVLREIRSAAELSQEELALECDLDRTYISMLERGLKAPTITTISAISTALKVSPHVFLNNVFVKDTRIDISKKSIKLPLLGNSVTCGKPIGLVQEIEKEINLEQYVTQNPNDTFYARAQGNSMEPVIYDGDLLVIDGGKKAKTGDVVLAQVDDSFSVKRLVKDNHQYKLQPENPRYQSIQFDTLSSITFCGVIVAIIRLDI